jgi:hypothetical protein
MLRKNVEWLVKNREQTEDLWFPFYVVNIGGGGLHCEK